MGKKNRKVKGKATNPRAIRLGQSNSLQISEHAYRDSLSEVTLRSAASQKWDELDAFLRGHIVTDSPDFVTTNESGDTPLHIAVAWKARHSTVMNLADKSAASLFVKNENGMTAKDVAEEMLRVEGKVPYRDRHTAKHGDLEGM